MSMRPLSLSTAADSMNCGPRGGDKAWTKKFTCLGVLCVFSRPYKNEPNKAMN